MALTANEVMRAGFVRDLATGALVATTNATGAIFRGRFLCDPDGRIVLK